MNERLLTVEEAAAALRLNPQTVRRWLRQGRLRGASTGAGTRTVWRVPELAIADALTPNTPAT